MEVMEVGVIVSGLFEDYIVSFFILLLYLNNIELYLWNTLCGGYCTWTDI